MMQLPLFRGTRPTTFTWGQLSPLSELQPNHRHRSVHRLPAAKRDASDFAASLVRPNLLYQSEARVRRNADMSSSFVAWPTAIAWMLAATVSCAIAQTVPETLKGTADTGTTMWVTTKQRLKVKVYEGAGLSTSPILIVVVHGDSPDGPQHTNTALRRGPQLQSLIL